MADGRERTPRGQPASNQKASNAAMIGGACIVGAAAGYALIAFRFKNLQSAGRARFAAGSAEMRAAESMARAAAKAPLRSGSSGATSAQTREEMRRAQEELAREIRRARERLQRGLPIGGDDDRPPEWALREMGLGDAAGELSLECVKEAYRAEALRRHPDSARVASSSSDSGGGGGGGGGGDDESFSDLHVAYKALVDHVERGRAR